MRHTGSMSTEKHGVLRSLSKVVEGAKSVRRDATESTRQARIAVSVPTPRADASLAEKIAYLEEAQLPIGRLEAPAGAAADDAGPGIARGIALPLLELLKANVDTNPDLVDAVVEPLLAHRRTLS